MSESEFPLILEPEVLASRPGDSNPLIVDVSKAESYAEGHLPGAVHLDYAKLNASRPPAAGLLPENAMLSAVMSSIGLEPSRHVVAYDDEGGGKASRLLWTLDVIGHRGASLLNGGKQAWAAAGLPLDRTPVTATPTGYTAKAGAEGQADKDYILSRLGAADLALVDTRTPEEFSGENRRAERSGHIPGAVNFNWVEAMDEQRERRLLPREVLLGKLAALGVTPDKEVVAYCQTHHRSSHTYIVLKALGFDRVRGYPGAWSEWGNDPDTPIE